MKVQTKLILLMTVGSLLSTGCLLGLEALERGKLKSTILKATTAKTSNLADKILSLQSQSLTNFTYDYSYWDELRNFVRTRDRIWAQENLDVVLPTYELSQIWVYSLDGLPIYEARNLKEDFPALNLNQQNLEPFLRSLHQSRSAHFFVYRGELLEISAATIHPTHDRERKIAPAGYLIAARRWSKPYRDRLADLTMTQIKIQPNQQAAAETTLDLQSRHVTFYKVFSNWNRQPVAQAQFIANVPLIFQVEKVHDQELLLKLFSSLLFLSIFCVALIAWVGWPLRILALSLATDDASLVKRLEQQQTEFGYLAGLIHRFLNQKFLLTAEIKERQRIESELRNAQNELILFNQALETRVEERNRALIEREAQLRLSLAEKVVLLQEVHHRVKNNLQVISSMLRMQARRVEQPELKVILEASQNRVMAMSLVHENLNQTENFARIGFLSYVKTLAHHLFGVFGLQLEQVELEIDIPPDFILPLEQAIPCGLILNELITNACKHGFRHPQEIGSLQIGLDQDASGLITLRVANTGSPLPEDFDCHRAASLGLKLVQILSEQLRASFTITQGIGSGVQRLQHLPDRHYICFCLQFAALN